MATIDFRMNNLHIVVSGVQGYMDVCTYTNLDPVDYVYKVENINTGLTLLYRFRANTTTPTSVEGFRRTKTDETKLSFLGATMPS
jgi:hypothetical protein